ncbi:hypothetical protein [Photorhabdus sp. MH8.4]
MTGVRECSQQRSNLKDDGYRQKTRWSGFSAYVFNENCINI